MYILQKKEQMTFVEAMEKAILLFSFLFSPAAYATYFDMKLDILEAKKAILLAKRLHASELMGKHSKNALDAELKASIKYYIKRLETPLDVADYWKYYLFLHKANKDKKKIAKEGAMIVMENNRMTYQAKDNDRFAAMEKQLRQYKERIENEKYIQ